MATKVIAWNNGTGNITAEYDGSGNGSIVITTDSNNLYESRSQQITIKTTDGSKSVQLDIVQAARQRIDLSNAVVTAANQTYNGSAKTPTPTVTLNGEIVPSTGYDVSYSDNINAGTATITITGKGDYTGTTTGTFTINKATPSYTAPSPSTGLTYSGSAQYLTTSGSTSHGTIYYSTDGVNWYTTRRQGTNAGTYNNFWKLEGDSNHTSISSTQLDDTTIAQATGSVTTAPTARTLTYSGSGQYLVTTGYGTGTMYYRYRYKSYSSSSWGSWSSYSTSRPSRTNAGYYEVQYYAAASSDGNYTASATGTVSCEIYRASRTISFTTYTSSAAIGASFSVAASASAGSGTVSFSTSNSSRASISGSTVTCLSSGTCTITATVAADTNYNSASTSYTLTVQNYVDLGLPSGRLWAEGNLCKSGNSYYIGGPTAQGCYFSWANIEGHNESEGYDWGTNNASYQFTPGYSKSSDISHTDATYDAAYANIGSPWHLPSKTDIQELYDNTNQSVTSVSGVSGVKFTKKTDSSIYLFFPFTGNGYNQRITDKGTRFGIWSSELNGSTKAYDLFCDTSRVLPADSTARDRGYNIRAVR